MLATPGVARAQHALGAEFQVNSSTLLRQRYPAIAIEADGDFIVAWHHAGTGNIPDIFFRRFTSAGVPLAGDSLLNVFTVGLQYGATLDVAADGKFVVAWTSFAQDSNDTDGVFARRLDAAGTPLATEFQVNTITERFDYDPALAVDADGDFVVVWSTYDDQYRMDVFGQRFDSAGAKLSGEFQLNSEDYDFGPAIGMDASGGFVVVWSSYRGAISDSDVIGRRFDSAGTSIGGEFLVNASTVNQQTRPDVTAGADGRFVVAWSSLGQGDSHYDVVAQRFSSAGAKVGAEFVVNTYTPNRQDDPMLDIDGDGDFVVTWASTGQDDPLGGATLTGVFGQRFDSAGAAIAVEFQVNSYTTDHQRHPAIGVDSDGDFVVSWESFGQDGANDGLFAQRFSSNPATSGIPLDADGNGSLAPLTDGLLILRHLFNFTGATLVNGATAGNCTRCDGPAVQTYLSGLGLVLDIDGNGSLAPLSDGLLVLRYLFSFTGATLVNGAVGANCTRCDAPAIVTYLQSID